ncbi:MAG TPA: hypothetical protein VF544_16290 [Pyrinomonadaceae bacterium]|jgi:hypothetical protein
MKVKSILLVLTGAVLIIVGTIKIKSGQPGLQQQEESRRGTLKWHAQQAKAKGEQQVVIPAPIERVAHVTNLDEALSRFHLTALIGEPVEEKSFAQGEDNIATWYKFRVKEYLSQQSVSECRTCSLPPDVPQEFLPLKDDEILVLKAGGALAVDGVKVINQERDFPEFSKSQEYLLLLDLNLSTKVGRLSIGPYGVFTIDSNGLLRSVNKKPHPLKQEMQIRYLDSVERLRANLKERHEAPR